jgi:hypothetical protein
MTPAWLRVSLEQLFFDFFVTRLTRVEYRRPKNPVSNLFVVDEKGLPVMDVVSLQSNVVIPSFCQL